MPQTPEPAARSSTLTGFFAFGIPKMLAQNFRRLVTQWENRLNKLGEKLRPQLFGIHPTDRLPALDNFVQREPFWNQLRGDVSEECAVIRGTMRNQKCGAFRRERVSLASAGQQSQPNERVADGRDSADRDAGRLGELLRGSGRGREQIEQIVFHCRFDN